MASHLVKVGSAASALAVGAALAALPGAAGATPAITVATSAARQGIKLIHPATARPLTSSDLVLRSAAPTYEAVAPLPKVYLVFWGSQWSSDPAGAKPALSAFFAALHGSADTWGTILNQYCEGLPVGTITCGSGGTHIKHPTKSILAGVWLDNAAAEPSSATQAQLASEATAAAAHFHNFSKASNTNAQYVIASPSGTSPDGFPNTGFCGWHNNTTFGAGQVAYTNLPYLPDLGAGGCTTIPNPTSLDGYFSTETHEYAETETDLRPANGWTAADGSEIGDLCTSLDARLTLGGKRYDVQGLWSNAAATCVTHG